MSQTHQSFFSYSHWSCSSPPLPRGNHHLEGDVHVFLKTLYILENPFLCTKILNIFLCHPEKKRGGGRKDSNNKLSTVVLKLVTSEICSIFSKINFTLLQQQGLQRASQVLSGESACQCRRQRFDPLEEEMATHSSFLAWRSCWTEEPCGLQAMGSQRVGHDWVTKQARKTCRVPMRNL